MYTIHADGELLFSTRPVDDEHILLSPKLTLEANRAGSLSFVLPPGNKLHGSLKKLKSMLTVEQDEEEIFRSRVLDTETDIYKQQNVYCEGEKSFFLDSVHPPYSYSGTAKGLFIKLVANHNSMVDADRQFTVGQITAVTDSQTAEVKNDGWVNTYSEMDSRLLNAYGGYFRTRKEGGTRYIDWVDHYGDVNAQDITFTVNLLDLKERADAGDVFTVLIPLGASEIGEDGEYTEPVSVASVNNGLNYIQDDEAVALYGKIWRTRTWSYEEDPAKLMEKAREYLKTGAALETITLKAIDMHFVDGDVQPIRIGDRVRILSDPHGIDKTMICSRIELDLINPENTLYTFGEKPRTLTENVVQTQEEVGAMGGGGGGRPTVQEELGDIIRWAKISVDEAMARIDLNAGEINRLTGTVSQVGIELDGLKNELLLYAKLTTVEELSGRVSQAEASIRLNAENIELKVSKDGIISSINQTAETIKIQASRINLEGYVTASTFAAEIANINNVFAGYSEISSLGISGNLYAANANFTNNLRVYEKNTAWKEATLYGGGSVSVTSTTTLTVWDYNGNPIGKVNGIPSGFGFSAHSQGTINYLGY